MLPRKYLGVIGGGAAAAVILAVVAAQTGFYEDTEADILPESQDIPVTPTDQQQIPIIPEEDPSLQIYRIDTECELIYGLATGQYPNGDSLPRIELENLLEEYPQEFSPWKDVLENNETKKEFLSKPMTDEFGNVLIDALMEETSIKPELKPIAALAMDPQGREKLQQAYQQFNCKPYFDQRAE